MRTTLNPLSDRYISHHQDCRNSDFASDWESQMRLLTLSQFHVLRDSIDSLKTMISARRHDGEYGLR
ncbi:hypothetical protein [Leptolyngbya ohadii]|uniref:hypothetical protein n=1 Tax=Leptolyngbya ohadii TaxID=1962290 RepID=UPI00117A1D2B|nr:hypothetical protein [Leptolyngbya ohadii]